MQEKEIVCHVHILKDEELNQQEMDLITAARKATEGSYSPYSHFAVGAALLLKDGSIEIGSNQENASYPCGLCAERTALFHANAIKPDVPVLSLAIAAQNSEGFLANPITPCGACRQALLETENRFHQQIAVYLYGTHQIYKIDSIADLLPLQFNMD